MKKLQRKIMRGIYYAYALRLVSLPGVAQGFIMLGIIIALSQFVSISAVLSNLANVELGRLASYLVDAAINTELWNLLLVALFVSCLVSLRRQVMPRYSRQVFDVVPG